MAGKRKTPPAPEKTKSSHEWIYGLNPVLEAVRSGRKIQKVFLSQSRHEKAFDVGEELSSHGIKVERIDTRFLDERFPKGHQGIAALAEPRKYYDLEDLIAIPQMKNQIPLFLVLDCIEDPRNLGAALRVADAAGVHGAVVQSHRAASLSPAAVKASAGASECIPIARVPNIKNAMREMKDAGVTVVGAEAGAGNLIWETDFTVPLAFVIGSEGRGLRKTVGELCDLYVKIPMMGAVNSLNVSVAAGILLYEVVRQRSGLKSTPA